MVCTGRGPADPTRPGSRRAGWYCWTHRVQRSSMMRRWRAVTPSILGKGLEWSQHRHSIPRLSSRFCSSTRLPLSV